jgi:hypothetical protein
MNQVSSGPAGLLYSLSNELIMIYNELQDLYGKVAVAETSVQQSTIIANAASQKQAAVLRAVVIGCQAGEALAGAAVTGITGYKTAKENSAIDTDMDAIEDKLAPLKALDGMDKMDIEGARTFGQGVNRQAQPGEVNARMDDLLDRRYDYRANGNNPPRTDAAEIKELDQQAVNAMNPDQYRQYKDRLGSEIKMHEERLNNKQSTRLQNQTTFKQYGDIFSQGAGVALKGVETTTTTLAGAQDANIQVTNGVQSMANSTADSARGSIGQNYAKISDAIAAAKQGANAYAAG